jgi:hypothetical protein
MFFIPLGKTQGNHVFDNTSRLDYVTLLTFSMHLKTEVASIYFLTLFSEIVHNVTVLDLVNG